MTDDVTKVRCNAPACKKSLGSFPFDCKCCKQQFCIKHRLAFDHACAESGQLKINDIQKLEKQLASQVYTKAEKQHLSI